MSRRINGTPAAILALTVLAGVCHAQGDSDSAGNNAVSQHLWLSGQVNIISQGHSTFRSPYSGPNSFAAQSEIETSRVLTLYAGFRISATTDVLVDLEETNGRNLSGSHGLASFPNVDLAGVPDARPYLARAMLHHEFRLSGEDTDAERGPLQMADRVAARRLEIYVGRMSLLDFFDVNAVGSDSHYQFMNWTVDNNAAYGYPADARGYTDAAVAEYHNRAWALRFGEALTPSVANPDRLELNLLRSRSESMEFEFHHEAIRKRKGVIRALTFIDHGSFGDYRTAIHEWQARGTSVPDISSTRRSGRIKYGFGVNAEQELTGTMRAFARFGWAEGHLETLAFTEADHTFSGGFDLRGDRWRRKDDRLGVAGVTNGLSGDHREYLSLGGLGFVLGDGALRYGREKVVEVYYTAKIWRGVSASLDIQRIWNPGYNQDRGPALVSALRLHLEGVLFANPR